MDATGAEEGKGAESSIWCVCGSDTSGGALACDDAESPAGEAASVAERFAPGTAAGAVATVEIVDEVADDGTLEDAAEADDDVAEGTAPFGWAVALDFLSDEVV